MALPQHNTVTIKFFPCVPIFCTSGENPKSSWVLPTSAACKTTYFRLDLNFLTWNTILHAPLLLKSIFAREILTALFIKSLCIVEWYCVFLCLWECRTFYLCFGYLTWNSWYVILRTLESSHGKEKSPSPFIFYFILNISILLDFTKDQELFYWKRNIHLKKKSQSPYFMLDFPIIEYFYTVKCSPFPNGKWSSSYLYFSLRNVN